MILNDKEIVSHLIEGEIVITPLISGRRQIGASSIDLRLGTELKIIKITKQAFFDPAKDIDTIRSEVINYTETIHIAPMEPFVLHPDEFVLGSTLEYIRLSPKIAGRLEGRSTWGRVGLQVHSTAGFVDPGFEGVLAFELHNMGKVPLCLFAGVRIGQISFYHCEDVAVPYLHKRGAKYGRQTGIQGSLFFEDYEYQVIQKYLAKAAEKK